MGLDTSHDAWHGAYSAFYNWRREIARAAGFPPLDLMEGFYHPLDRKGVGLPTLYHGPEKHDKGHSEEPYMVWLDRQLPIRWDCLKPSPLIELLSHSDCDGEIEWWKCGEIGDALDSVVDLVDPSWKQKTEQFIDGLYDAYVSKENLEFR